MKVLIYESYQFNNAILYQKLIKHYGRDNVEFCDTLQISNDCLKSNVNLLVMPGGADLFYREKLTGENCKKIKEYVEQGGAYLGICAGAYFACRNVEWAKGLKEEIIQERELNFYDGLAVGPIYEYLEENAIHKSWQNAAEIRTSTGTRFFVHYEAGPLFKDGNCDVIARYEDLPDKPAAIIKTQYGNGHVILSSPHLENCSYMLNRRLYKHNNPSYEWESSVAKKIEQYDKHISQLWELMLDMLTQEGPRE
jgi:glutamine amidotransferase-like uncharacterized protein